LSKYIWRGGVNQIPVVDGSDIVEVRVDYFFTFLFILCLFKLVDHHEKGCKAAFMIRFTEQLFNIFQTDKLVIFPGHFSLVRHYNSQKTVPFTVSAFKGLKEPGEKGGFFFINMFF
jgi:hypothetical protein